MTRKAVEWHFLDPDTAAEWDEQMSAKQPGTPVADDSADETSQAARKIRYLYELSGVIALLYGLTVYLLWQQAAQRIALLERDIATLRDEFMALEQSNLGIPAANNDENGNIRSIETAYLRFEAHPETMATVKRIAPLVDAKLQQLQRDFELELSSPAEKLQIIVLPATKCTFPATDEHQLIVPHPRYAAYRYDIREADALTTERLGLLSKRLIEQVVNSRRIKPQWQSMTQALKTYMQLEYSY